MTVQVMPSLVAVAHGTRDPAGDVALQDLARRVRGLRPGLRVTMAYVDHTDPSVSAALVAEPGPAVVVLPLLLTAATHSKGDVAAAVQRARTLRPGVAFAYGRPLGPHPLLLSALADRLAAAGADRSWPVVLAAAGAADPDANAEVVRTARLLWEWRSGGAGRTGEVAPPAPPVEAGFASATWPSVGDVVRRFVLEGHRRVAVAPLFLAPGYFVRASAAAARAACPEVVVGDVLAGHDDVARLVLARYDEAVAGDVRMSCDVCMYRTPWPGREGRMGADQVVHPHPGD